MYLINIFINYDFQFYVFMRFLSVKMNETLFLVTSNLFLVTSSFPSDFALSNSVVLVLFNHITLLLFYLIVMLEKPSYFTIKDKD